MSHVRQKHITRHKRIRQNPRLLIRRPSRPNHRHRRRRRVRLLPLRKMNRPAVQPNHRHDPKPTQDPKPQSPAGIQMTVIHNSLSRSQHYRQHSTLRHPFFAKLSLAIPKTISSPLATACLRPLLSWTWWSLGFDWVLGFGHWSFIRISINFLTSLISRPACDPSPSPFPPQ